MFKIVIVIVSLLLPQERQVLVSAPSYTQQECQAKLDEAKPKLDAIAEDTQTRVVAACVAVEGRDI
jgi:histidinol-phosphate/aromatic aminotransferase/cobyric acid decarboxylase-like protein